VVIFSTSSSRFSNLSFTHTHVFSFFIHIFPPLSWLLTDLIFYHGCTSLCLQWKPLTINIRLYPFNKKNTTFCDTRRRIVAFIIKAWKTDGFIMCGWHVWGLFGLFKSWRTCWINPENIFEKHSRMLLNRGWWVGTEIKQVGLRRLAWWSGIFGSSYFYRQVAPP
jgi:hypothetical protein